MPSKISNESVGQKNVLFPTQIIREHRECSMKVAVFLPRQGHCAAVAPEGQNVYNRRCQPAGSGITKHKSPNGALQIVELRPVGA